MISKLFRLWPARLPHLLGVALLLAACTPSYNWREMEVADGHVQAAFPAKVQTQTREIALAGHSLRFTLTMAQVDGAMFAVGHAPLPPEVAGDPAARDALGHALMQSLYANLSTQPPQPLPAYGDEIEVRGQAGQQPGWLMARVWVTDTMLIDAVAAGTEQTLPRERAQEFVRAVKLNR
ncbi:hypothetical protein [Bordetella sp. BOR01]|uniref:hypothetical protein n=1 Tax=Bordetella sp. BOR01 TaxID=2854779 RepID=UPI001C47F29E|nr:hypothetical protein [Bordetella sp. BOR01]MBV7484552.1 hypothetical protein [Bordetella sp. BOR01]